MADASNRVPDSLTDDPSDVSEALSVARSLWDKGEQRDAIRWVRRAAEAAEEAGTKARVVTLSRAAAELEQWKGFTPTSQTRPASRPLGPAVIPPPLPTSKRALKGPEPEASPSPSPSPSQRQEKRVRVSVRTSARDPGLLVVRQLAPGEAAPAGTREAFLVMTEPATKGNVV